MKATTTTTTTKKYNIYSIDDDGKRVHEHNLVVEKNGNKQVLTLYYSESEVWTEHTKGVEILQLNYVGDDYFFQKLPKKFDASTLEYLRIMLNAEEVINNTKQSNFILVEQGKEIKI